jgi:hypothetical protein
MKGATWARAISPEPICCLFKESLKAVIYQAITTFLPKDRGLSAGWRTDPFDFAQDKLSPPCPLATPNPYTAIRNFLILKNLNSYRRPSGKQIFRKSELCHWSIMLGLFYFLLDTLYLTLYTILIELQEGLLAQLV